MANQQKSCDPAGGDPAAELRQEVERLRLENARLREREQKQGLYLRAKIDQLLQVIGTAPLRPEELDDDSLLSLDPIGIVSDSFVQVLEHLRETNDKLKLAQGELEAILNAAGAGILVLDAEMRVVSFNRKIEEMFLAQGEGAVGRPCYEVMCDPAARSECVFEAIVRSGHEERRSDWVYRDRQYEVVGTPIRDEQGNLTQVILVYSDMTERNRISRELADAKARQRTIFEAVQAGIVVVDADTHQIVDINETAQRMLAAEGRDVVGRVCHSYICPAEHGACPITDLGQTLDNSERMLVNSRGDTVPILKTVVPVELEGRRYLVESFVDITHRKEAEEAIHSALCEAREAQAHIDGILQSVADPLVVTDRDERIVLMNRAAEELLGVCLRDSVGLALKDAVADERLRAQFVEHLSGEDREPRWDIVMPDGEGPGERVFQGRTSQITGHGALPAGVVIIMHEVTLERKVERAKSEFVSTAAHELQTPLTAILGFSELLLDQKDLPEETKEEALSFIYQKAEALSRIVDDLLDLSRIEAGRPLDIHQEPCEVGPLLEHALHPYRERLKDTHRLELQLPDAGVEILADQRKFQQVMENLLSNAFKYSPGGGLVRVAGRLLGGIFEVEVADQGVGMSPDQVERVFDKFYRGDATDTSIGGTGLGMSIVKHIVEGHGGRIAVESKRGAGTTVSFTMPLVKD